MLECEVKLSADVRNLNKIEKSLCEAFVPTLTTRWRQSNTSELCHRIIIAN